MKTNLVKKTIFNYNNAIFYNGYYVYKRNALPEPSTNWEYHNDTKSSLPSEFSWLIPGCIVSRNIVPDTAIGGDTHFRSSRDRDDIGKEEKSPGLLIGRPPVMGGN